MFSLVILICSYRLFHYLSEITHKEDMQMICWDSTIEQDNTDIMMADMTEDSQNNNLIVNYLPETTTQSDLQKMFDGFGDIESCKLICHKTLGHSLGYGFVKYLRHEDAQAAIDALNGLMMQNKKLKVSFARPANEPIKTANLYISGLKNTITEAELVGLFTPFGKVLTVKVMNNDNDASKTSAIGFVRFEQHSNALVAVEALNGKTPAINRTAIHVSFAKQSKEAVSVVPPPPVKPIGYPPPYGNGNSFPGSRFGNFGKTPSMMGKNLRFDPMGRNPMSRGGMGDGLYPMHDSYPPEAIPGDHVLFVFNLSPEVEELHLWRLFGPFGAIRSVTIITDKSTNKSKGFAFITMSNYTEAENAICHLDQSTLEGKVIQVSFKKAKNK